MAAANTAKLLRASSGSPCGAPTSTRSSWASLILSASLPCSPVFFTAAQKSFSDASSGAPEAPPPHAAVMPPIRTRLAPTSASRLVRILSPSSELLRDIKGTLPTPACFYTAVLKIFSDTPPDTSCSVARLRLESEVGVHLCLLRLRRVGIGLTRGGQVVAVCIEVAQQLQPPHDLLVGPARQAGGAHGAGPGQGMAVSGHPALERSTASQERTGNYVQLP